MNVMEKSMDYISKDELLSLISQKNDLSLSIYIPTQVSGTDSLQNRIIFKNTLKAIKSEYPSDDYRKMGLNELLDETEKFTDDYEFWQHQSNCLAMFLSKDFLKCYSLPIDYEDFFYAGTDYYILPLISFLNSYSDFYILYLSRKEISLHSFNHAEFSRLEIKELSDLVNDEIENRQFQKQTQFFTGAGEGGRKDSRFYGTGAKDLNLDKYLVNFFNKVDRVINKNLQKKNPLILAGVDYLIPLYMKANTYPLIMDGNIHGNLNDKNINDIINKAKGILEQYHKEKMRDKITSLVELKESQKTSYSGDLEIIVNESYNKRIVELYIFTDKKYWGNYNHKENKIDLKDKNDFGAKDMVNTAAINTIINGGDVYVFKPGEYDAVKPFAAKFRY